MCFHILVHNNGTLMLEYMHCSDIAWQASHNLATSRATFRCGLVSEHVLFCVMMNTPSNQIFPNEKVKSIKAKIQFYARTIARIYPSE